MNEAKKRAAVQRLLALIVGRTAELHRWVEQVWPPPYAYKEVGMWTWKSYRSQSISMSETLNYLTYLTESFTM